MASDKKTTADVPEVHQPQTSSSQKGDKEKCAKKRPQSKPNKAKKHHAREPSSEPSDDSDSSCSSISSSSGSYWDSHSDSHSDTDKAKKGTGKSMAKVKLATVALQQQVQIQHQSSLIKIIQQLQLQMQQMQQMQHMQQSGQAGKPANTSQPPLTSMQTHGKPSGIPPKGNQATTGNYASTGNMPNMNMGNMGLGHYGIQNESQDKRKDSKLEFKRVDQVWDSSIHKFKLQATAGNAGNTIDTEYNAYLFHVRRAFDWEGKYKATMVDIKSKVLRDCLQEVMGNLKGVSLVEDNPKLAPNLLFLYLEDLRKHIMTLKEAKVQTDSKKEKKRIETKRQQLKVLVNYIDTDYADVKKRLYPMLENGLITFDLLWALWKPSTLAYTTTYGSHEEPRVFKVERAEKHSDVMSGPLYLIEGKYFEYDGKNFGFGSLVEQVESFRGARKITSLKCYPLAYHNDEATLRKELIQRGKKFVGLNGVHFKSHQGLAYCKNKKSVLKVNINGRIMVDPSIYRRIHPNYSISMVRPKELDCMSDDSDDPDDSDEEGNIDADMKIPKLEFVTKIVKDSKGMSVFMRVPKAGNEDGGNEKLDHEKLDHVSMEGDEAEQSTDTAETPTEEAEKESKVPEFTDEEYLMASPVVLGFAFGEKLWLEFTVSGVKDIQWNDHAYESLVLEAKTKDIIKVLVESHKYHAAESIDDVIQGKGKGLVAVLHGPPGTGKTLTAEGISELLKCPLYMVSAGELGTDPGLLEGELHKILNVCHAWGAILLLDEADVFLEKRDMREIHRNALVSIFLRQLEYFQGILFLTTNRVQTFDEAFQSRIHIALRYDKLDHKAKKAIFKIFIERVRVLEKSDPMPFTEEDLNVLARNELNGREIKNMVKTAQALAVNKGEALSMAHITQVMEVQIKFRKDLAGGHGFEEAMRSYS